MRIGFSFSLIATALAFCCACGGRSDKDTADAGSGGTGNTAGTGGASAGSGGSNAGGTAGHGGGTAGGGSGGSGGTAGSAIGGDSGTGGMAGGASCQTLLTEYGDAYEEALKCDPDAPMDACTQKLEIGLACGCGAFVNPENGDAIDRMVQAQSAYSDQACNPGVVCGPCLEPIRGQCSAQGRCENVNPGNGRSCKVAGKIYLDGEAEIPDPTSCNTCSCYDGLLACTEIGGCEKPCPAGYAFGIDCAQCGPTDACEMPEYDCFKTCGDGCGDPGHYCIGGLCLAGVCG